MHKRTGRIAAALALGLGASAVAAAPASAGVGLWQNDQFSGGYTYRSGSEYSYHDGDTFDNGAALGDAVTSLANDTSSWTCFYWNHHYEGDAIAYNARVADANIGLTFPGWNDQISSHYVGC